MAIDLSQFITGTVSNVSSVNVLFSSAVSSGSLMVADLAWFHTGAAAALLSAVVDNVNANNYTVGCNSTMVSDTAASAVLAYKINASSGAGASTYRVSFNMTLAANLSVAARQYTGGPFTVGSTASSNGTSSSPRVVAVTASSTPVLIVMNAIINSTAQFNPSVNTGTWRTTIDTGNVNQIFAIADSTNSSLTQQPTFGLTTSTRWLANALVFTGLGAGSGAATLQSWALAMGGVQ